jgi:type IV fimbrial biogenesis protein FimT
MFLKRQTQSGVTLVEILIAIAAVALLMGLVVPTFRTFMMNQQIRNGADAIVNGMNLARSEAIRRNKTVEFAMGNKLHWTVSQVSPRIVIQDRASKEGSKNADVSIPSGASMVTFNALGAILSTNSDGSIALTQLDVVPDATLPSDSAVRILRITVSTSGSIRMCDPPDRNNPPLPAGDPRRCQ